MDRSTATDVVAVPIPHPKDKMKAFLLLGSVLLFATACSASSADDESTDDGESALTTPQGKPMAIPTTIKASRLGSAGTVRYGQPLTKVVRPSGWGVDVTTLTLRGTPGDEVEIAVSGRTTTADPAVVVLGSADPIAIQKCETTSSAYLKSYCYGGLERPVVDSNDDADATTKNAKLRTKLVTDTLTIGVLGVSVFDITATSIASALDPSACVRSSAKPTRASHGSFDRVTLTRDCRIGKCDPWRELGRESRNGNDISVGYSGGSDVVTLTDNDGPYATFGGGWAGGIRTTEDCKATTYCSLSAGTVSCGDWERAIVSRRGATAIDSDTCTSQLSGAFDTTTPRFSGVLGDHCVSLHGPVRTTYGAAGSRTETQTFIVKSW